MQAVEYINFLLNERYIKSIKHNDLIYPIYKDINSTEVDDILKEEGYGGVRFGVENPSVIYGWNVDLIHE